MQELQPGKPVLLQQEYVQHGHLFERRAAALHAQSAEGDCRCLKPNRCMNPALARHVQRSSSPGQWPTRLEQMSVRWVTSESRHAGSAAGSPGGARAEGVSGGRRHCTNSGSERTAKGGLRRSSTAWGKAALYSLVLLHCSGLEVADFVAKVGGEIGVSPAANVGAAPSCRSLQLERRLDALVLTPATQLRTLPDAHATHAATAGGGRATSLASRRRFWAMAASVNSNWAPRGPRSRRRPSRRMRFR